MATPTLTFTKPHYLPKLADELRTAVPDTSIVVEGARREHSVKDPDNPGQYIVLPAEDPDTLHVTLAEPEPVPPAIRALAVPTPPVAPTPPGAPDEFSSADLYQEAMQLYRERVANYAMGLERYQQQLVAYYAALSDDTQAAAEQAALAAYQAAKAAYDAKVAEFLSTTKDAIEAVVNAHDPTPPVVVDPFVGLDDTALDAAITAADAIDTVAKAKAVLQGVVRNQAKMARYLRRQAGHA